MTGETMESLRCSVRPLVSAVRLILLTMAAVYQPVDICDYNHLRKGWRAGIDREGKKLVIEMKMDDIDRCHTYERHTHVLYSRS